MLRPSPIGMMARSPINIWAKHSGINVNIFAPKYLPECFAPTRLIFSPAEMREPWHRGEIIAIAPFPKARTSGAKHFRSKSWV
jgi:hypothetical protein